MIFCDRGKSGLEREWIYSAILGYYIKNKFHVNFIYANSLKQQLFDKIYTDCYIEIKYLGLLKAMPAGNTRFDKISIIREQISKRRYMILIWYAINNIPFICTVLRWILVYLWRQPQNFSMNIKYICRNIFIYLRIILHHVLRQPC